MAVRQTLVRLRVARRAELVSGHTSPDKIVALAGPPAEKVQARLVHADAATEKGSQ